MKTPKRTPWQHTTQPCINADGELRCTINEQAARWKRKNRVKQLKNTISKLMYENAVFKQTFIQKRAFLKRLKVLCREPNRSPLHRLADLDRELQIELMATKDYERKEHQ